MGLPTPIRSRAEHDLTTFCDKQVPASAKAKVRVEFEISGLTATIYERRPPWRPEEPDEEWASTPVARFRFNVSKSRWALYWIDSNEHWHPYDLAPSSDLRVLLAEVNLDPTSIFWG